MEIKIDDIIVAKGRRPLDQAKVEEIAASIKAVGLIVPIGIRRRLDGAVELVVGGHRLEACRQLGWEKIDATDVNAESDDHAKMVEIAENLHRNDLTTSQRNELRAAWVALLEKQGPDIGDRRRYPQKPGRKPSPSVGKVAKASGLSTKTVKEAIKTTKVSPAVKKAADRAELSQKQRLAISRMATEAEQLAVIEATYNRHFAAPDTRAATDASKYADVAEHRATFDQFKVFLKVFTVLESRGDAAQVAEAVLLFGVDEDTVPRLRRVAAFATKVADIMSSKWKSSNAAAAGAAS
jgi:ParB-like chromosome segregation protein Spo0J